MIVVGVFCYMMPLGMTRFSAKRNLVSVTDGI